MTVLRNSVGIWAFGPAVTRFVPPGYHPGAADEPMVDKTRRVAEGLSDLLDGLEYHYPGEMNEENVEEILSVLEVHRMAGDLDYLLRVAVPDMAAFDSFYRELIAAVPLKNVSSHFGMERVKDTTAYPILVD